MRLFTKLFFSLFLLGCSSPPVKNADKDESKLPERVDVLEDLMAFKSKNSQQVIKWFKLCSETCKAPDREIALNLYQGYTQLFQLADLNPNYRQLTQEQAKLATEGTTKVRSAFFQVLKTKSNRDVLETAYRELASAGSMYRAMDKELDYHVRAAVERLKKDPTTRATGFYLEAISLPPINENALAVVESFRNCLLASAMKDQLCRDNYEGAVKFIERPKCKAEHFNKQLRFDVVDAKGRLEKALMGDDLLEASLESGPFVNQRDDVIDDGHAEIWLMVKSFSTDAFTKIVDKNVQRKGAYLRMSLHGEKLVEVPLLEHIEDGRFRVGFKKEAQAQAVFAKLCLQSTPDELPTNLKLAP